jgi:hypothetical protein
VTAHCHSDRALDEVHYHDRAAGARQRRGVTADPAGDIDDQEGRRRERETAVYHPRRRHALGLGATFHVARIPEGAVVPRTARVVHG